MKQSKGTLKVYGPAIEIKFNGLSEEEYIDVVHNGGIWGFGLIGCIVGVKKAKTQQNNAFVLSVRVGFVDPKSDLRRLETTVLANTRESLNKLLENHFYNCLIAPFSSAIVDVHLRESGFTAPEGKNNGLLGIIAIPQANQPKQGDRTKN